MPIRAVLFDLDDTLYERRVAFRAWATAFVQEQGTLQDAAEIEEAIIALELRDANGYGNRLQFVNEIARRFPTVPGSPEQILEQFRVGFVEQLCLTTEVRNLLETLQQNAIPIGIITNGSTAPQIRKIKRLGLEAYTNCIFVSEAFGRKKPDPAIFHAAATCLGVPPEAILFVGDHWENDIIGAKNAGMQTAWLSYNGTPPTDERYVDYVLEKVVQVGDIFANATFAASV